MPLPFAPPLDQRVVHYGRSWEQFKLIQQGFDQAPGVRLFYFDGTVEVLMPGREYERFSWVIGHLIGLFLAQKGVFFSPPSHDPGKGTGSICPGRSVLLPWLDQTHSRSLHRSRRNQRRDRQAGSIPSSGRS
ncbi:MAG: hypothetical protein RLZZ597_2161 [Cyanobacteriota bacterium]